MKFGSLFAGFGGIDLGLEWAGMECVWQVENDDYCNSVLEKHWPDVERFGDVRQVGKDNLAPVDLIAGGFPCQPHSVAGKRRGAEDDRNLWPEFSRIIDELQPRYVLAENVPGIITTYIDEVLSDLENKGYTCGTFNIPAVSLDAPHRRERIFIVGYSSELGRDEAQPERPRKDRKSKRSVGGSGVDRGVEDVADSASERDRAEIIGDKVGGKETKRSPGRATRSGSGSRGRKDVGNADKKGLAQRESQRSNTQTKQSPAVGTGDESGRGKGVLADTERASLGRGTAATSSNRRGGKRTKAGSQNIQPGDGETHASEFESGGEIVADSEGYIRRASGDERPKPSNRRSSSPALYLAYTWSDRHIYCYWSETIQNWQEIGVPIPHSKHTYWLPEPNVGRVVDGLSLELDFARQIRDWCDEQGSDQEKKPARNELTRRLLRAVWEYRELAAASPELYIRRLQNSLPEVPLWDSHSRWLLGPRIEENQGLRDMWEAFYAESFEEARNLQFRLLERAWSEKLGKTVASRVGRLRGLGNAVVPQVAEWVGLRIMEFDTSRKA